jgi:nicotinamide-nucleotide amidase
MRWLEVGDLEDIAVGAAVLGTGGGGDPYIGKLLARGAIEAHGAVSEEVARAMAEGALARSEATLAVSVTGIAGPGGSEHKPEGRVCFGLARKGAETRVETVEFGAIGRSRVRAETVAHALDLLIGTLS